MKEAPGNPDARRDGKPHLGFGHCGHAPKCINDGVMDDRDPFGCCNCGTRKAEQSPLGEHPESQSTKVGGVTYISDPRMPDGFAMVKP